MGRAEVQGQGLREGKGPLSPSHHPSFPALLILREVSDELFGKGVPTLSFR